MWLAASGKYEEKQMAIYRYNESYQKWGRNEQHILFIDWECEMNDLDIHEYLEYVLSQLQEDPDQTDIQNLLSNIIRV